MGFFNGCFHVQRVFDFLLGWLVNLVDPVNLPWVNQGLAVKAEFVDVFSFPLEAFHVVHVGEDGIEGGNSSGPGGVENHIPRKF